MSLLLNLLLAPFHAGAQEGLLIGLTAVPPELDLASASEARVDITVQDGAGAPVSGARLEVLAMRGRASAVREIGDGRYEATYRTPVERFPQLEILVARVAGRGLGFVTLPLHGVGMLEAQTEPGAKASLLVTDGEFGPVQADAKGKVFISFSAPPGVSRGTLLVGDQPGGTSREVDLGVPPIRPLTAVAGATELAAEGVSHTPIDLFAIGQDGRPLSGAVLRLEASAGSLTEPSERAAGWYRSEYRAPDGSGPGYAQIVAQIPGQETASRFVLEIALLARPAPAPEPEPAPVASVAVVPMPPQTAPSEAPLWRSEAARFVLAGFGLAAVVPGAVLMAIDGKETCSPPAPQVRCPEIYHTYTPGIFLVGAGSALIATSLVLAIVNAESAEGQDAAALSVGFLPTTSGWTGMFTWRF